MDCFLLPFLCSYKNLSTTRRRLGGYRDRSIWFLSRRLAPAKPRGGPVTVPAKGLKEKERGKGTGSGSCRPDLPHTRRNFLERKIADVPHQKTHVFRPPHFGRAKTSIFYNIPPAVEATSPYTSPTRYVSAKLGIRVLHMANEEEPRSWPYMPGLGREIPPLPRPLICAILGTDPALQRTLRVTPTLRHAML